MKAVGNKILVKVELGKAEKLIQKSGGFMMPDSESGFERATIVSVGEKLGNEFQEGEVVLIKPYSGTNIEKEGEIYRIITTDDILVRE
jgi:co-chaperonin GroES (HSP10)